MIPIALTIAGSDPSGGAGIQADLKTFHQHKVYGMAVVTLLTVQNTKGVQRVDILDPREVMRQLDAVLDDIRPAAAKTGALGDASVIRGLARRAGRFRFPLVIDPVMVSKHGASLLKKEAVQALIKNLLPYATLVTPNLAEAELLSGIWIRDIPGMEKAAKRIYRLGPEAVLVKGGHLKNSACDLLYDGKRVTLLDAARVKSRHTHGTGCAYSAAITARIARGESLLAAIRASKKFITRAIRTAPGIGHGFGPVNHFAKA